MADAMMPGGPVGAPPLAGPPAASAQMQMPAPMPQMVHDVTIEITRTYECARVENVPPEEFGVTRRQRSVILRDCDYCYHEVKRTQAQLIAEDYDEEQVKALPSGESDLSGESIARDTVDDTSGSSDEINKANREITVTEHYIVLDYEGNGKPQRYRITTGGDKGDILKQKGKLAVVPDRVRFVAMTPVIMTHRFFGRSIADLVMDIQKIKTALLRSLLDNMYLANNQRTEIAESHATKHTIDDLLSNRPGGIVRTKQPGGLQVLQSQSIGSFGYPLLEYMDATREWRTGVTRQGQGIDADALQNQTATAVARVYSMAQARMRLIARIFAETGIKELFWLLHATIRENATEADTVKLRNKWVPVDPREWRNRDNLTVNVGLGFGSKDQELAFLMNLLAIQKEAIMAPATKLVTPNNIYNTLKQIVQKAQLKSIEPYFTDPASRAQEPTPPSPEVQEAQAKLQIEQKKNEGQMQLDQAKAAQDAALQQAKMTQEGQLKREQMAAELQLKREQIVMEMTLKREQLVAELQLKRELGFANAAAKAQTNGSGTSSVHVGGEPG